MRGGFRFITERLEAVIKNKAGPLLDKGSSVAANAASTAFEKGKHAVDKGSSALSRSAATAYKKGKVAAIDSARSASKEISGQMGDAYRKGKSIASDQVTEATRKASKRASETISEGKKASTFALRWLWWWSLAAVGVYGIATTVPKELVRIGFDNMTKKKDDGEETASSQAQDKQGEDSKKENKSFWGGSS